MGSSDENRWLGTAFIWEGGLLLLAAMSSIWRGEFRPDDSPAVYALIAIAAVAMGVRTLWLAQLSCSMFRLWHQHQHHVFIVGR